MPPAWLDPDFVTWSTPMNNARMLGAGFVALLLSLTFCAESGAWGRFRHRCMARPCGTTTCTARGVFCCSQSCYAPPVRGGGQACPPGMVPVKCVNGWWQQCSDAEKTGCLDSTQVGITKCPSWGPGRLASRCPYWLYPMVCDCFFNVWRPAFWGRNRPGCCRLNAFGHLVANQPHELPEITPPSAP